MEDQTKNQLDSVGVAIGRIQGDTQHILRAVDQMKQEFRLDTAQVRLEMKQTSKDLGERLTAVEKFVYRITGVLIVLAVVVPMLPKIMEYWAP